VADLLFTESTLIRVVPVNFFRAKCFVGRLPLVRVRPTYLHSFLRKKTWTFPCWHGTSSFSHARSWHASVSVPGPTPATACVRPHISRDSIFSKPGNATRSLRIVASRRIFVSLLNGQGLRCDRTLRSSLNFLSDSEYEGSQLDRTNETDSFGLMHVRPANEMQSSLLRVRGTLRQEIILTSDSGRTKLGKLWLVAHAGEEWVGVYCRIEAIVSLY
jgi:hypothetical protein